MFNLVGWKAYFVALRLDWEHQPLALCISRTSFFLVNFGFWVGSLWGDDLVFLKWIWSTDDLYTSEKERQNSEGPCWQIGCRRVLSRWSFALAWAIAIAMVATWGARHHSAFVVNTATTFGAIHFYTQYFERFRGNPISLFCAGVIALGGCLVLAHWNTKLDPTKNTVIVRATLTYMRRCL